MGLQSRMRCGGHDAGVYIAGGCSTDSQLSPYFISNTSSVCDAGATNAPLPNLPVAGTAYECPTWKLNSGPLWMGLGCLAIMTILMSRNFKVSPLRLNSLSILAAFLDCAAVTSLAQGSQGARPSALGGKASCEHLCWSSKRYGQLEYCNDNTGWT